MAKPELTFPVDLKFGKDKSLNAFMTFTAYDWGYQGAAKKNQEINVNEVSVGSVALPITDGLEESQGISWEVSEGVGAANLGQILKKNALDFVRGIKEDVSKLVEAKKGVTVNDLASLTFGLSDFREFEFTFKMIPKNQQDSIRITEIIRFFKASAIADFSGSLVRYPRFFTVKAFFPDGVAGDAYEKLLVFELAVITNISVNYFPEAITFYRDGAPTTTQLSLSFKELKRISGREFEDPTNPAAPYRSPSGF